MSKRILAILLSSLMVLSTMPTAFAEETGTNSEAESSVAEEAVEEEATPEPTVEPTLEPADESGVEATTEPTAEPTATPEPTEEPKVIVDSGICGADSTWTLDSDGVLTISGTGEIYESAFEFDENIISVVIEDGITSIGDYAFDCCYSLTSITIPDSVTSIESGTFYGCNGLTSIAIPDSVTSIGYSALSGCHSLTSITIPDSVTSIGDYAFSDCPSLTSVTIPDSVTSIGNYTFFGCSSLTSVTIPDSVTSIEDWAFGWCSSLTSITIPEGVTSIGVSTFYLCSGLTSITIPGSVTSIGDYVFAKCSSLKTISYSGTCKEWNKIKSSVLSNIETTSEIIFTGENAPDYYVSKKAKAPTCTKAGNTEEKTCSVCGDVIGGEVIKATGHKYSTTIKAATTSANGKKETKCSVCGDVKSSTTIYKIKSVVLNYTSYAYSGSTKTPTVIVKDYKGNTLKKDTDYTVSYPSSRKYPGTYKVTVKFKGNYSGTKELTFKIVPKGTTLSSVSASSKAFTAKWNLQKTQTTGYQIEYSTSSKFSSGNAYKTITKNTSSSLKVTGLKAKTKYYVRVRVYKTVNGTKVYSSWSSAKSVITK
jgi:hypothetical protein